MSHGLRLSSLIILLSFIIKAWKKKTAKLNNTLKFGEDEGVPLNSFLFYLVDGIIPLITTFCAHLCDDSTSSLLAPRVVSVLKSINDAAAVSRMNR